MYRLVYKDFMSGGVSKLLCLIAVGSSLSGIDPKTGASLGDFSALLSSAIK